jgi:excisionase family DNA binding protein
MTIPEAAASLGLATSTLRHQIAKKKLKARRMGGRWYVSEAEVARYKSDNKRQGESDGTP